MQKKAVVLFSGGLDSAICLALAHTQGFEVYALTFDYGQRHAAELTAAKNIVSVLQVAEHKIISLTPLHLDSSALTDKSINIPDYVDTQGVPVTYVPARNTIFLSIALGYAEVIGAYDIFIGVNSVDFVNYPDCRPEYITAFERLANLATKAGVEGQGFTIQAPLLNLSKAEAIALGNKLGVDYLATVTCYQANEQGHACGTCSSCIVRRQGFAAAEIEDATIYAV